MSCLCSELFTDYSVGLQGDNGRFELLVEKDGQPYAGFEVVPELVLNTASVLVRVKDTALLDYETTQSITFQVRTTYITINERVRFVRISPLLTI